MKGIVTRSTGSWYEVRSGQGKVISCRIRGKFKLHGFKLTNPVGVGDKVKVEQEGEDYIISKILPRENYIARQSPRKKHNLHLLAANVDQAMIIVTVIEPMLKQGFIDRCLLMTEPHDIPVVIVINKMDLYGEEERQICGGLDAIYTNIGYRVVMTSATVGDGLDEVKSTLRGQTTMICGQSGVGKSSIINALYPGIDLQTDILSNSSGKGQHTTTFSEMLFVEEATAIIDTPGIKTLSFNNLEIDDVAHNFREFFQASHGCKFRDCTHRNEPKCAVKAAIESGDISVLRYQNYLAILDEIEAQNYWERHKDM